MFKLNDNERKYTNSSFTIANLTRRGKFILYLMHKAWSSFVRSVSSVVVIIVISRLM